MSLLETVLLATGLVLVGVSFLALLRQVCILNREAEEENARVHREEMDWIRKNNPGALR